MFNIVLADFWTNVVVWIRQTVVLILPLCTARVLNLKKIHIKVAEITILVNCFWKWFKCFKNYSGIFYVSILRVALLFELNTFYSSRSTSFYGVFKFPKFSYLFLYCSLPYNYIPYNIYIVDMLDILTSHQLTWILYHISYRPSITCALTKWTCHSGLTNFSIL